MSIEERIGQLTDKYDREVNRNQSEADLRSGYIDLLFLALGWNVYNDPDELTNYRREGYIRGAGYVDVGLEIALQPVLLLEAKRFGVLPLSAERVAFDRTPEEKQLFRYARGKKIPHCILTNFERLHVFNADHERLVLAFDSPEEYLHRLPELLRLSPEKVSTGSITASERQLEIGDVDEGFLTSLQGWRKLLADTIYRCNLDNPALQEKGRIDLGKLMSAVQRILDRLILIRYADDKEVLLTYDVVEGILTDYRRKGSYARPDELMQELIDFSHRMDERHNTTLFQPGHICEQVTLPNEALEKIMVEMNNISFRKFTSDVLGNTYETYLGTKLVLKNGEIKAEERRDVRKAGGIFYTPPAIVRYIVDDTLGRLLDELESAHGLHAIEQVKRVRILDPACGSGSFLIYAYNVLADFYRRINDLIESERVKLLTTSGATDLFERLELFRGWPEPLSDYPRHILEKQLHGVDVDPEAAEIAAVNLTMQAFADERREKLPLILNENVKVGNSLISGSEETLCKYFGGEYQDKKPFNWEQEFDEIMQEGGFDIVVGNPPYVQLSMESSLEPGLKEYLLDTFAFSMGRLNTFGFFMQRGVSLLKQYGFLSYIVPNTFLTQEYYRELRKFLLDRCQVVSIATLEGMPFRGAVVENVVVVLRNETSQELRESNTASIVKLGKDEHRHVRQNTFLRNYNYAFAIHSYGQLDTLRSRIDRQSVKLEVLVNVNQAIALKHNRASCLFKEAHGVQYKKVLDGRDIARYSICWPGNYLLYDVAKIHSCRREDIFLTDEKILFRRVGDRIVAALDTEQHYALNTLVVATPKVEQVNLRFILALLNSRLLNWYFTLFLKSTKRVFSEIQARQIKQLPVRRIDHDDPTDKALHDSLVSLADEVLRLNKRLASLGDAASKDEDAILSEISRAADEIDEKVYQLYGLTKGEKQIVKASFGSQR